MSSIPLPSLSLNIEWLKLRSALIAIPVPQPLTSNPQPKPYRIFHRFNSGHAGCLVDKFSYKKTGLSARLP